MYLLAVHTFPLYGEYYSYSLIRFCEVIFLLLLVIRTAIVYAAVIGGLRFTGKRQLGELSPSEFAVTILVSELACIPLQDAAVPLLGGMVPLATLLSVEVLLSYISRRSRHIRRLLSGNPCVVIKDGQFDAQMLRSLRLTAEDILDGLRFAGVTKIEDVRYAIIETNGQLSVILRAMRQPLTADDLKTKPSEVGMPLALVSEGKLIDYNIRQLGKSEAWVREQCRKHGAKTLDDVFLLTLDDCGNVFYQQKTGGAA
ncbi:MAG TPA: hypothetical protein DDX51_02155 [Clostridiales bacterium]|nr:hypothetical protein [Clostridiales bacterium]